MNTKDHTKVKNNKIVGGRTEDHLDLLQYFLQENFLSEKTRLY